MEGDRERERGTRKREGKGMNRSMQGEREKTAKEERTKKKTRSERDERKRREKGEKGGSEWEKHVSRE